MARTPFSSKIIADVGISMGDEGKGRLIAELVEELQEITGEASPAGIVMKVNGGANSGHTAGGLKFNLLPCGVITKSVPVLGIGAGVVADPRKFWWEIKPLEGLGYKILERLLIDERTQVSDLTHRMLDLAGEHYRSEILREEPRGSTGRGISPSYVEETSQFQMFFAEFRDNKDRYAEKLKQRADRAVRMIQHVYQLDTKGWDGLFETLTKAEKRANAEAIDKGVFPEEEFDFFRFKGDKPFTLNLDELVDVYWEAGHALKDNIGDVREAVLDTLEKGNYMIGEFGQSYWLDKRQGFPPNVSASHTFTPEIFQSAAIPVQPVHTVGVCKAYDTKVGTHVFITEMADAHPLTVKLKELEYGTSTGRQRMVGWFDAVEKGDVLRYGGYQDLMINKLDALTYSGAWQGGELLVCTAYRDTDGELLYRVPRDESHRRQLQPVYQQLPGWSEDISEVRHFDDLPANAKRYIAVLVEATLKVAARGGEYKGKMPNLRYIGVGPDPSQIIKDVPETAELLKLATV